MTDWQPIETAPEGVDILGYIPPHKEGAGPHYVTCYRTDPPHSPSYTCHENVQGGQPCNPTHWMRLPGSPSNGGTLDALVDELSETKKRFTDMETKALDYEHALNAILSRGDYIGDDEMGIPVHLFDGRYPEYAGMTHYQIARAALLKHQWRDI